MDSKDTWTRSYRDVDGQSHTVLNHGDDRFLSVEADRGSELDRQIFDIAFRMNAKIRNIELLETALTGLSQQSIPLRAFVRQILEAGNDGMDVDGGTIQNMAVELGLLIGTEIKDNDQLDALREKNDNFYECEIGDIAYAQVDWLQEPEVPKPISDKLMEISAADTAIQKAEQGGSK